MSFCKHRVMDKCKKDGKLCIYSKECFEPEEQKPMTNADHIRYMTDEELAKWLFEFFWGRKSDVRLLNLAGWLKQPYKEDT